MKTSFYLQHQFKPWQIKAINSGMAGLIIALTLLPVLNITYIVTTTGANNLSNDYLESVWIVDQVLNGAYDWSDYFRDTFVGDGHSKALPILVRIGLARFAHWNIYLELYLVIVLTVLKLFLVYDALTYLTGRILSWLLWPLLAALLFSTSQVDFFTYGDAGLWMGLVQFGLALGLWGVVRFRGQWLGLAIVVSGGIVATWSGGSGPVVWPVLLIGLVLLQFRQVSHYVALLTAAVLASLPYIVFMVVQPIPRPRPLQPVFSPQLIVRAIGWPFAQDFSPHSAQWSGWSGLILCLVGLGILWSLRRSPVLLQSVPALLLITYGAFSVWLTTIFRGYISSQHTANFMLFWVGLLGLAYILWVNQTDRTVVNMPWWSVMVVCVLGLLYFMSNLSFTDKASYLYSRSPSSSACLRNYQTAPTYCERQLFQWYRSNFNDLARLAQPLERNHLSVFAPCQEWTLQGDFVLDNVHVYEAPGLPDVFWSADRTTSPVRWFDYRHLNLILYPPNKVTWTLSLPTNVEQANFHSAIAISESAPVASTADGVLFEVSITQATATKVIFSQQLEPDQHNWQPFTIPLQDYIGQTITFNLTSKSGENSEGDWAMYRYPYIALLLNPNEAETLGPIISPSNTELSPLFRPKQTPNDFHFDALEPALWAGSSSVEPLQVKRSPLVFRIIGSNPYLYVTQPLNICLSDYTHLYIKIAVSPEIRPRALQFYYQLNEQDSFAEAQSVKIPLLADGEMHEYTYDFKLLELDQQAQLTGIRLDPVDHGSDSGESLIHIADFRLIHRGEPSRCSLDETY